MPRSTSAKRTAGAKPARERIPNPQRSAATRKKLLDATIESLAEVGYHRTSTVSVSERAGVSRGTMLHHFPTKADLIMAASDRIVEMRRDVHAQQFDRLKNDRERFLHLIDALWVAFQTPSGIARIEILVGARSDADIGPRFRELNDQLEERHKEIVWESAQTLGIRDRKKIRAFVQLYAAALRGLTIDSLSPGSRVDIRNAVNLLKEFQLAMMKSLAGSD